MTNEVQDKKAEFGINVGNVLQGLLLASTVGFGTSIVDSVDKLTVEVAKLTTSTILNANEIGHNTKRIEKLDVRVSKLEER